MRLPGEKVSPPLLKQDQDPSKTRDISVHKREMRTTKATPPPMKYVEDEAVHDEHEFFFVDQKPVFD